MSLSTFLGFWSSKSGLSKPFLKGWGVGWDIFWAVCHVFSPPLVSSAGLTSVVVAKTQSVVAKTVCRQYANEWV